MNILFKKYWLAILAITLLISQQAFSSPGNCYRNKRSYCFTTYSSCNSGIVVFTLCEVVITPDGPEYHYQPCTYSSPAGGNYADTETYASGYWTTWSAPGVCNADFEICGTCCGGGVTTGISQQVGVTVSAGQFLGCPGGSSN